MQIYIHRNNQQLGPFTEEEIKAQLAAGTASLLDHVWWQGQQGWVPLGESALMATDLTATPELTPAMPAHAQIVSPKQQTSGLAMASLITSIVSTLTCGLLFLPAIILGHLGLNATKKPEVQGRGLAVAGLILAYVQLVIFCIVLFLFSAPILALIGLGAVAKAQLAQAQAQIDSSSQATNTDQTTNAPDQTAPAPATTNNPDQSTHSAPATPASPDSSTNNPASSTNATDSSTNAAPTTQ